MNVFFAIFSFVKKLVCQCLKLQFGEDFAQFVGVGLAHLQFVEVEFNRHVGFYRREEFREFYLLGILFNFFLQCALQLVGLREQLFHSSKLVDKFHGCLLADARTSRNVVGRVAHQSQKVDHLTCVCNAILGAHLLSVESFVSSAVARAVHHHVVPYQLAIVLVGRKHVCHHALCPGLERQRAYNVVGLVSFSLQHGYAHGLEQALNDGHRAAYVLGSFLSLRLIFGVSLGAEGRAVGVEGHSQMRGFFFREHFVQRVAEAHHGRCVEPFRVDTGVLYKCVIRAVYQRVSVKKEQLIHVI